MNQPMSGGGGPAAPPTAPPPTLQQQAGARRLDPRGLRDGIAERRRRLIDLEIKMVAVCEAEAARGHTPGMLPHDRATWDQATWDRYLAAAVTVEARYGPLMRRLYREIDQLERVLALPVAGGLAA